MPINFDLTCPHCGAKVGGHWQTCWLCGLELPASLSNEALAASLPPPSRGIVSRIGNVSGVILAVIITMIIVNLLATGDHGGAIALVVLLLPAAIVTLTRSIRARAEGGSLTAFEKMATFFTTIAVTIGAIAALSLALFVALFIACMAILTTGGMRFH